MEETTVVIVGAGPSGLALGALLGRMKVKVLILEKDTQVCEDPRGIVVNGDAVRISYQIGIGEGLTTRIGKDIGILNFHRGNFRQPAFMKFDITVDWAEQAVSNNVTQFQPNYEREIRALLAEFPTCELRTGCEVVARKEEAGDSTVVEYLQHSHDLAPPERKSVRTTWLVGADGKRGVVRKKFLEPEGIKQEDGEWTYVGTWVAANLKITTPTPSSHPDFPLWKLGYTPQEVHDVFWPSGFHFCNDSQRPAVSGRFGPPGSGLWRHEYSVEPQDNLDADSHNVEAHFWSLFSSWLVIPGSTLSRSLAKTAVSFPRDCIEVVRCRPFTFATKIVNRWFSRRTFLIGDAAHVFPPFGGQGIATGIRDAQALGWRLAMIENLAAAVPSAAEKKKTKNGHDAGGKKPGGLMSHEARQRVLTGWSQERRQGWRGSMLATKLNGSIVNQRGFLTGFFYRAFMRVIWQIPFLVRYRTRRAFRDKLVFDHESCPDGFFLGNRGGGRKIAQVWVRRLDVVNSGGDEVHDGIRPALSDSVLLRDLTHLALLVLVRRKPEHDASSLLAGESRRVAAEVSEILEAAEIPDEILTLEDVTLYVTGWTASSSSSSSSSSGADGHRDSDHDDDKEEAVATADQQVKVHACYPCSTDELARGGGEVAVRPINGYKHTAIEDRFAPDVRFVLVRPDFVVHSVAADGDQLLDNLRRVKDYFC